MTVLAKRGGTELPSSPNYDAKMREQYMKTRNELSSIQTKISKLSKAEIASRKSASSFPSSTYDVVSTVEGSSIYRMKGSKGPYYVENGANASISFKTKKAAEAFVKERKALRNAKAYGEATTREITSAAYVRATNRNKRNIDNLFKGR